MRNQLARILRASLWRACCSWPVRIHIVAAQASRVRPRTIAKAALACIAQVCVMAKDGGMSDDRGRREAGDSKLQRAPRLRDRLDVRENVCRAQSMGVAPGSRYSGAGESCQAKNDCAGELGSAR